MALITEARFGVSFLFFFLSAFIFLHFIPNATADLTSGLKAHWKLDGNGFDNTGNGYGLSLKNPAGIQWVNGRWNKGVNFPDGTSYLQAKKKIPNLTGTFSVSFWMRPAFGGRNTTGVLLSNKNFMGAQNGFEISYSPSQRTLSVVGKWKNKIAVWTTVALKNWNHVVFLFDASGSIELFFNGTKRPAKEITPISESEKMLTVGRRSNETDDGSAWFGSIDDVRIYTRTLDSDSIKELYTGKLISKSLTRSKTPSKSKSKQAPSKTKSRAALTKPPASGINSQLVGLWKFENNGLDTSLSGKGGSITFGGDASYVEGKWGKGIGFDGNGFGTIPATTGPLHNLKSGFSISIWVYPQFPASNAIDSRIVSKKEGWDSTSGWEFNYNQGAQFFDFLGSGATMAGWTVNLENGKWYNLILLVSGTQVTFYLDGNNMGTNAIDPIVLNDIPVTLGRIGGTGWTTGTFWYGRLDDLRIYNRILTASDIAAISGSNP